MPHPHGQIYGYSFIPLKIEIELKSAKSYFEKNKTNLFDAIIWEEQKTDKRIIFETAHFLVFLPFFTDYPFGVFIVAKNDAIFFSDFSIDEKKELGIILKDVVGMFDALYDKPFPYMMCVHQAPVNAEEWEDSSLFYRFHIEFYPPLRSSDAIKYYASSEMGAWAAANTRNVEETVLELKMALKKYKNA
jgi:UDPglucose--hexose-1-phosphate uridylyltransferase